MESIQIIYRNYGHWDFYRDGGGRLFRLRGSGIEWQAIDEMAAFHSTTTFKSFTLALAFITEALMFENLRPDGYGNNLPRVE